VLLNKNIEKPIHTCFLNWKHGATSIEADGVAEGFTKSFEMHGVKYSKLIGKILLRLLHKKKMYVMDILCL
jgi:hypothetical protein